MPFVESVAAAVQLEQIDQAAGTATVLVSVLAPVAAGASESENTAIRVGNILHAVGAVCTLHRTEYIRSTDLFCTEVWAVFAGYELSAGWVPTVPEKPPTFSVALGSTLVRYPVSFTAERAVDGEVTSLANAQWYFTLEERFPLSIGESSPPAEPFSITVSREGRTEVYSGCVVTSQKRILEQSGQRQIRRGTATGRSAS